MRNFYTVIVLIVGVVEWSVVDDRPPSGRRRLFSVWLLCVFVECVIFELSVELWVVVVVDFWVLQTASSSSAMFCKKCDSLPVPSAKLRRHQMLALVFFL